VRAYTTDNPVYQQLVTNDIFCHLVYAFKLPKDGVRALTDSTCSFCSLLFDDPLIFCEHSAWNLVGNFGYQKLFSEN
jgi:hypothetical protein